MRAQRLNRKPVKSYVVVYQRDADGCWAASVPSVRGCRTQGRSLSQTRERIREALSLFAKDPQHRASRRFFELADRLARSTRSAEQKRLKQELARLTFAD